MQHILSPGDSSNKNRAIRNRGTWVWVSHLRFGNVFRIPGVYARGYYG
jgi:hypothetical protein